MRLRSFFVLLFCALGKFVAFPQASNVLSDSALYYRISLGAEIAPSASYDVMDKWLEYLKNQLDYGRPYYPEMNDDFYDKLGKTRHDLQYEFEANLGTFSVRLDDQSTYSDYVKALSCFFRKWHTDKAPSEVSEKKHLVEKLQVFFREATNLPLIYKTIQKKFHGNVFKYVDYLYSKGFMNNKKKLYAHLQQPSVRKVLRDPGWQFVEALHKYEVWLKDHDKIKRKEWGKYVYRKDVKN